MRTLTGASVHFGLGVHPGSGPGKDHYLKYSARIEASNNGPRNRDIRARTNQKMNSQAARSTVGSIPKKTPLFTIDLLQVEN
jgi:hypothetical protein